MICWKNKVLNELNKKINTQINLNLVQTKRKTISFMQRHKLNTKRSLIFIILKKKYEI